MQIEDAEVFYADAEQCARWDREFATKQVYRGDHVPDKLLTALEKTGFALSANEPGWYWRGRMVGLRWPVEVGVIHG
jgi:hypothetical protein